ncbi:MAG: hypothetical protein ABW186_07945 [Rhodanobacteraceae bacterium]
MRKKRLSLALCAAFTGPAFAADAPAPADPALQAMDARIRALEADAQKLREQAAQALAEAGAARAELEKMKAQQVAAPASVAPPPDQQAAAVAAVSAPAEATGAPAGGANGNAFNPAIAVILNGQYAHHSENPDRYVRAGFPVVPDAGPGPQGLSLGESEISFAANVDDKFYGQFTVSYHDDNGDAGTEIEEAYIDTLTLPDGFNVRAGRFFSNIGYLNSHHTHTDNFVDRPLAYQAFLGNQYGDDGAQVRWVAPTDTFLELGGEAFRGEDYPSGGANHSGVGAWTLFAHAGGDVGTENSWLAGLSMLKTRATGADDGFSGDSTLYLADGTWKWAPNGNTKDGGLTLRSELFFDQRDGVYTQPNEVFTDPLDPLSAPWVGDRRGAYLEAVYRLDRTWDIGYRYDKLWSANGSPFFADFDPQRHSLQATWRNSEFSFFRIQYSHDEPERNIVDNAWYLQYDVALGAHGAHKF